MIKTHSLSSETQLLQSEYKGENSEVIAHKPDHLHDGFFFFFSGIGSYNS
jgi:hypothetical protein